MSVRSFSYTLSSVLGAATLIGDSLAFLGDMVIELGEYANLTAALAGNKFPRRDDSEFPRHARLYGVVVRTIRCADFACYQSRHLKVQRTSYRTTSELVGQKALRIAIGQINNGHTYHLIGALHQCRSDHIADFLREVMLCMPTSWIRCAIFFEKDCSGSNLTFVCSADSVNRIGAHGRTHLALQRDISQHPLAVYGFLARLVLGYAGHRTPAYFTLIREALLCDHSLDVLQQALEASHESVVELLMKLVGIGLPFGTQVYWDALLKASSRGDTLIVRLLLEGDLERRTRSGKYGEALRAASNHGHREVVELLLGDRGRC